MIALILVIVFGVPQCATEDSPGCVWIASDAGNGNGHDVFNLPDGETFIVLP